MFLRSFSFSWCLICHSCVYKMLQLLPDQSGSASRISYWHVWVNGVYFNDSGGREMACVCLCVGGRCWVCTGVRATAGVKRWRHFNCGVSQSRCSPNKSECLSVSVCVCKCEPELIPVIINSLIFKTERVAWFCLFVLSWNIQSHVPVWLQCGIGWIAVGR